MLAEKIKELLTSCGFSFGGFKGNEKEELWIIDVANRSHERRVEVWTSIVGDAVRGVGTDAIRACVTRDKGMNGLVSSKKIKTRVNRTGQYGAIRLRLYKALRVAYQAGLDVKTW